MPDGPSAPRPGFSANSPSRVRHHNRRVLLHALRLQGSLSRAELARATGLTPQAIAKIIEDLIGAGLVRETGRRKAKRGQPPIEIEIAREGGYALGIRIDRTHFHAVAADLAGGIIETREGEAPSPAESDWLDFIVGICADFAGRYGSERCLGLGLVTPGPFDTSWPSVPTPGAVSQLQSRVIAEILAEKTGTDVLLENDATAAALGEKLYGEAVSLNDFFYVFIGEGVGGGIVIKGAPYRGNRGNAGEFGHAIIDPHGPLCYCGNRGCLGEYLSLSAMRRDLAQAQAQGQNAEMARKNWIRRAGEALSIGLTTIENLFDPERIIIGGAAPASLLEEIAAHLHKLRPSVRQDFGEERLRLSTLGERSAALGASALPILAATSSGPTTQL